MLYVELPKDLVPWPPMSAIVAMVRSDGVLLVADRRTVTGPRLHGPGTAPNGPDATKLGVTRGGCVWALAGHAAVDGLDLREVVSRNAATDPAVAAREIRAEFGRSAAAIRSGVWEESGFPVPEMFARAHAVALIAGRVGGTAELRMVGLMVDGPASEVVLGEGSIKVLAPPPLGERLPIGLESALGCASIDDAIVEAAGVIRAATLTMSDLVSRDLDAAVLAHRGSGVQIESLPN